MTRRSIGKSRDQTVDWGRMDRLEAIALSPNAPPVRRRPGPLARRFYQICMAIQAEGLAGNDLTALQYGAMSYLSKHTGDPGIDQNGLAARMGIDRNNASLLVDQLEAKGLAERRVNGADRRARLLYLTPKGEKLFVSLRPAARAINEEIFAPIEPHEREVFLDLLVRLIKGNWQHARPGAGRRKRRAPQPVSK